MTSVEAKPDTKQRILDSAERLFAAQGVEATSLRTIIADARVNLAAIHYHYHSKEDLLDAVLMRRIGPVNRERLKMLDACGPEPSLEAVLEAFIAPAVRVANQSKPFVCLMGRIISERSNRLPRMIQQHFQETLQRFRAALGGAAPELSEAELFWRIHFTVGAMAHTLRANDDMKALSNGLCDTSDVESVTRRLVAFAAAGFRAGVPHA